MFLGWDLIVVKMMIGLIVTCAKNVQDFNWLTLGPIVLRD